MPGTPGNVDVVPEGITGEDDNASLQKVSEIAIPDIARYQEQLLRMILHHDDRALRVLSLYVTVIGALVTAFFALRQAQILTSYVVVTMVAAGLSLLIGCVLSYRAAWTARIYLPGRKPDFWIWAIENEQDIRATALAYAMQAREIISHNENVADRAANRLTKAYIAGLAAPIVGAASAWVFYWS